MIPELGHFALILALLMAAACLWRPLARQAVILQAGLCLIAYAALLWSYLTFDFTVISVAENTHTLKPLAAKFASAFANPDSLALLGVNLLSFAGVYLAVKKPGAKMLRLTGIAGIVFIALTLFVLHPFARIYPPPFDGVAYDPFTQEGAPG